MVPDDADSEEVWDEISITGKRRQVSRACDFGLLLCCGGVCEALVEPAVAVQELLRGSKWCLVQFLGALHHAELPTKLAVKRF